MDGYEITVTDAKTNELLYRGKLKTDFAEDYNGALYAINIGQREKPLTERRDEESWVRYSSIGVKRDTSKCFCLLTALQSKQAG